jgi:hypothetical protein
VVVLVGDMVVKGGIKSIQREMAWPGPPVRHIIKVQHNAGQGTVHRMDPRKKLNEAEYPRVRIGGTRGLHRLSVVNS